MQRLHAFLHRRRGLVLIGWLALAVAAIPFAARQSDHLTGTGFQVPGSQSVAAEEMLEHDPGRAQREHLSAVLRAEKHAGRTDRAAAVRRLRRAVTGTPRLARLSDAATDRAAADLRRSGLAVVPLDASGSPSELLDASARLRSDLEVGGPVRGVQSYVVGQTALWAAMQDLTTRDLREAETTGFPIVLVILLAMFGSAAAALLPFALGAASVTITGAIIFFLSQQTEMSVYVTSMASMIGIGVAVDYSLFILARYRQEIAAGRNPDSARARAVSTSGLAVVFSGTAVVVSLASLWLINNTMLRSMAMGAIVVVSISVLAAVVLLPALIALFGKRAYEPGWLARSGAIVARLGRRVLRRRHAAPRPQPETGGGFWRRWTELVMRRPLISIVAVGGVLVVMALPVLSIKTSLGIMRQLPRGHEARVGTGLAASKTGPGAARPVEIVARFREGSPADAPNRRAVAELRAAVREDPEVARVAVPGAGRSVALLEAAPRHEAESAPVVALVERLREQIVPHSLLAQRASVAVGGSTATIQDVRAQVSGSMWKIIAFVLGVSYLVLLLLLRSVLLPLKAVLMNLLSIGAAYGVLVAIFQWGWLDGFFGFQSLGSLDTFTPPLVFAVVFGLSMDYEVFLLSRIRERYEATSDNRRAVAEGLASSARIITSAALIMVSVFAVFVGTGVPTIKEIGLGNAVAIAIDATLVRLILVPAIMALLGEWNWWLPKPLERFLPEVNPEQTEPALGQPVEAA